MILLMEPFASAAGTAAATASDGGREWVPWLGLILPALFEVEEEGFGVFFGGGEGEGAGGLGAGAVAGGERGAV